MDTHSEHRTGKGRKKTSTFMYLVTGTIFLLVALATWGAVRDVEGSDQASARAQQTKLFTSGAAPKKMSPAPDFSFTLLDGKPLALSELRGKVVILNFWASWCPPCRAEARGLERVWQAYKDKGVVFLGVDIQDTEQDARAFLKEYGITYPNGQDTGGDISIAYGLTGIPETFFITRDGRVARHWIGPIGEKQLSGFIDEVLLQ